MGWLWQVNRGGSSSKTPTASATVADLRQDRIRPKKSLGQNFLTDDSILERIVLASGVKKGDKVLEIGPGERTLLLMIQIISI